MKNKNIWLYIGIAAGVIILAAAAFAIIFFVNPDKNAVAKIEVSSSAKSLYQMNYKAEEKKEEEPQPPETEEKNDDNVEKEPEKEEKETPEEPAPTKTPQEIFNEAKAANDKAAKRLSSAQSAYNSAKAEYDAAASAAADAVEKEKLGLKGFLQARGSSSAMKWFSSSSYKYANLTKIGDSKDATSFANVRRAIKTIESYNQRRASMGLAALKIDDGLMAMAAVQANTARTHLYHNEYRTSDITECIAAQCSNPVSFWFDSEKKIYDAAVAKDPSIKNMEIWDLDANYPDLLVKTAHYLNVTNEYTTLIGAGAAYKGSTPYDVTDATFGDGGEDVASWKKEFENYASAIESKTKGVSAAKTKLSSAEKELNSAKTAAKEAESNLKKAQSALQ